MRENGKQQNGRQKKAKKNVDRLKQKLFRKWFEQSKSGKT